ncbi:MAG TPA: pitrilysin family protein [Terriglobia bacterium]|nr:pitrilysin family protein [Terriglobia bacterium]
MPFVILAAILLSLSSSAFSRDLPPTAPPPKPVVLPLPALRALANGLQVVIFERHTLPLVTLRLVVKSGAEADPPDLPGEAQFVASLLDEGTATRSSPQIAAAIDDVGGLMDTGADWDQSYGTVTVLTHHLNLAFDLLSDIIIHPAFRPDDVERIRKQTISALKILKNDPSYLADTIFNKVTLAGTPYSHPQDGGIDAVRRISVTDLHRFHDRTYQPSNSILAVVGDVSPSQAMKLAGKYFGSWQGSGVPPPAVLHPPRVQSRRQIVVIDKPDAVQTEIRIGNAAIARDNPDYLALNIANQILGGPANNRLFDALRSRHGLAYGASSDLTCYVAAGKWEAKTSTRTSGTLQSIQLILDQMKRLRKHAINDFELESAQSYLVGHMALQFETSDDVASHELTLLIDHLPLDYWNQFPGNINALTPQEIAGATRRYLDPRAAVIVLVGNAVSFKHNLNKFGDVHVIPIDRVSLASTYFGIPDSESVGR